jgi:CBS domain-containing protein
VRVAALKVWEVMKEAKVYVLPGTPLTSLKEVFRKNEDVKVIPVVKDERSMRVLGFITRVEAILPTSHRSKLRVKDVLREFPVIKSDSSVEEAYRYLREFNVSAAPVVDEEGRLQGTVSLHDMIEAFLAAGVKPIAETVSEIMTVEGVDDMLVSADERVTKVWSKLVYRGYPAVIVVRSKDDPVPIGIITPHDLVRKGRWLFHREIQAGRHPTPAKARRIMTRGVIVAKPDTRVEDVARLMVTTGFRVLPVVNEEGKVIGIVRDVDIVRSFIEGRKPGRVRVKPAPRPIPVQEEEKVAYHGEVALVQRVQAVPKERYVEIGLKAGDIAREELPAITINDTVEHARKEMLRRKTDILLVVDEAGRIVGYVSSWTMMKAISLKGPLWRRRVHERFFIDFVMSKSIPRVKEDEPIENVAFAMISSGSEVVIVEDKEGSIKGFITKDDVVRAFAEKYAGKLRVEDVMVPGRMSYVHPHHSMAHAINKMRTLALDAIAVYDGSRVTGVISANRLPFVAYEDARVARKSRRLLWVRKLVKGGARRGRYIVVAPLLAQDLAVEVKEHVKPDDDIFKAIRAMEEENVNGLPVLDEEGRLLGIVTKTSILREMARHAKPFLEKVAEEEARAAAETEGGRESS